MEFGFGSFYTGSGGSLNAFGSFFDTTTQSTIIDTPTPMVCNNVDFVENVMYDKTTGEIEPLINGFFNLQFSSQLFRIAGGSVQSINIWFAINGLQIPDSNTKITMANNNHYLVASWNYFAKLNANDKIQIMYSVTDANLVLQYAPENLTVPYPAIPSVIKTINKIGDF